MCYPCTMAEEWDAERPWARQPWDTELGWCLFGDYLVLPDRPRRMRDLKGHPLTDYQLAEIARVAWWQARAALWDEHLAQIRTSTIERVTEETAEQAARRQVLLARRMQRVADKELSKLEAMGSENAFPLLEVTARDIARLGTNGIRLERLVMGEATERVAEVMDLSALSLDELRQLRALQDKAGVR